MERPGKGWHQSAKQPFGWKDPALRSRTRRGFFFVLLRKYSNVWRSQTGRQRGTRALLKYFGHKQKSENVFFSALCPLGAQGPAANCIIALPITYDSLPVRTGPDVLFFDNAGSFRAIMLVQFPA